MNWTISYTNYNEILKPYFNEYDEDFDELKSKFKNILQTEDELNDIVQLVGKDSLSEDQKVVMEIARIIREDFLKQNAFSDYDYFCPLFKTIGMMKCIIYLYDKAQKLIAESSSDAKVTWNLIDTKLSTELYDLTQLKFEPPKQPEEELKAKFLELINRIEKKFRELSH